MIKTTTAALVCLGVTLGSSGAIANDMNSAGVIDASELTNIQFLSTDTGANGFRFDYRERRDEVKGIIEERIAMVRERRLDIAFILRENEDLTRVEREELFDEFVELKSRLGRLYADRRGVLTWGIMDLEELEEFYSPSVSVS